MSASLVQIRIPGGIQELRCPITGIHVIHPETGFNPESTHSPYLRFFVDWIGGMWVVTPTQLPLDEAKYQAEVIAILERASEFESENDMIAHTLKALPDSAFVIEILNPPAPTFSGEICYACFDLGAEPQAAVVTLKELAPD
jgi:hypothetical protein